MRGVIRFGFGVAMALGLAATAAAQDVKTDWDKKADFAKYKTFSIDVATKWGNPLGEKRALEAVGKTIAGKGWKQVPGATADAVVLIHGATQVKRDLTTFYSGYGGGYRYGAWGGGMGTSTTMVNEYNTGTMIVDIFDGKTKDLLWRGTASDEISDKAEKNEKRMNKAAEKMFKKFPPKPGDDK
jgi:hypothetical protein